MHPTHNCSFHINLYTYSNGFEVDSCVLARGSQRDVVYLGLPIAPSYMSPNAGGGVVVGCGVSANEYSCAYGFQINFGDLTPYLAGTMKGTDAVVRLRTMKQLQTNTTRYAPLLPSLGSTLNSPSQLTQQQWPPPLPLS
jgi:hypothetical protein